jgi:hypothetical protein
MTDIIDENIYYNIVNNNPVLKHPRYLDAKQPPANDVYMSDSFYNNSNQKWLLKPTGEEGEYYLENKNPALTHPRYLDAKQPPANNVYMNDTSQKNANQKWTLTATGEEYYLVNNNPVLAHPRYLDARQPPANNVYMNDTAQKNANQRWALQVSGLKPEITFVGLDYHDAEYPKTGLGKVDFITEKKIINNAGTEITETVSKTITQSSTFEWGLEETLMVGAAAEVSAEVPFFGQGKATFKTELTLKSHQKWVKTESEAYTFTEQVKVLPHQSVKVNGYMDWAENYTTPYTLTLRVEMLADTVDGNQSSLSSEQITQILKQAGCTGIITSNADGESVEVALKGRFSGSYGMKSYMDVQPISE